MRKDGSIPDDILECHCRLRLCLSRRHLLCEGGSGRLRSERERWEVLPAPLRRIRAELRELKSESLAEKPMLTSTQLAEMPGKSIMNATGLIDREQLAREYPLTRGIDGELRGWLWHSTMPTSPRVIPEIRSSTT